MNRLVRFRLRPTALVGFAFVGLTVLLAGCSDGTGNPQVGSISSVKKGSDSAPPTDAAPKAGAPKGRIAGDR